MNEQYFELMAFWHCCQ